MMAFRGGTHSWAVPTVLALILILTSAALAAQNPPPAAPAVPGAPAGVPAAPVPPGTPPAAVVCLTCHSQAASEALAATPGAPPTPRLEGQQAEYLVKQLRDFKAGKRKNDLMKPVLATLGNRQFTELAAHFSHQTAERPSSGASSADQGRALYEQGNTSTGVPACVGCHQANGTGALRYPRLAGQRPAYVLQQLNNFKQGARTNDRAHVMRSIAAKLTDDEMRSVAAYFAAQ